MEKVSAESPDLRVRDFARMNMKKVVVLGDETKGCTKSPQKIRYIKIFGETRNRKQRLGTGINDFD